VGEAAVDPAAEEADQEADRNDLAVQALVVEARRNELAA
jgi:hypothetical protein